MARNPASRPSRMPRPPRADFALVVDFDKTLPHPQRIFRAVDEMLSAFQHFDHALTSSIDSRIEPVLMLEDIETGSLKVWLRNVLNATDDEALKSLDWKPQVGKYLVRSKYIAVSFLNRRIEISDRKRLQQLSNDLKRLAEETDVRHLPDYMPLPVPELLARLHEMHRAKAELARTDKMTYISDADEASFDMEIEWSPETVEELYVKEMIKQPAVPMILLIKKPDYIGESQWEFRHGRHPVVAKIADTEWLRGFQNRQYDVRPGDALRCQVSQEIRYGYDNEVINERYIVERVDEILENRTRQLDLPSITDNE